MTNTEKSPVAKKANPRTGSRITRSALKTWNVTVEELLAAIVSASNFTADEKRAELDIAFERDEISYKTLRQMAANI